MQSICLLRCLYDETKRITRLPQTPNPRKHTDNTRQQTQLHPSKQSTNKNNISLLRNSPQSTPSTPPQSGANANGHRPNEHAKKKTKNTIKKKVIHHRLPHYSLRLCSLAHVPLFALFGRSADTCTHAVRVLRICVVCVCAVCCAPAIKQYFLMRGTLVLNCRWMCCCCCCWLPGLLPVNATLRCLIQFSMSMIFWCVGPHALFV